MKLTTILATVGLILLLPTSILAQSTVDANDPPTYFAKVYLNIGDPQIKAMDLMMSGGASSCMPSGSTDQPNQSIVKFTLATTVLGSCLWDLTDHNSQRFVGQLRITIAPNRMIVEERKTRAAPFTECKHGTSPSFYSECDI